MTTSGRLGESLGFAVFPSLVAFERFLTSSESRLERGEEARPEGPFHSLPPRAAAEVERRIRTRCRRRRGPMAIDKLRERRLIQFLYALWEAVAKA